MLLQHYKDILAELSTAGADYLLVGAFALAVHEFPRATGDIDIWVRPNGANATKVFAALASFGAPLRDLTVAELARPRFFYQIGVAPVRIDILTSIDGVEFEDAWQEREYQDLFGLVVPVISRRHLLINKKATGRPKDMGDVAWLEARNRD